MKYCSKCGKEVVDEAEYCPGCGCRIASTSGSSDGKETMRTVAKVFMILGCISVGWALIPLAWCIPITVSIFKSLHGKRPISTAMKICTLIFVSVVSGICLLCADDK